MKRRRSPSLSLETLKVLVNAPASETAHYSEVFKWAIKRASFRHSEKDTEYEHTDTQHPGVMPVTAGTLGLPTPWGTAPPDNLSGGVRICESHTCKSMAGEQCSICKSCSCWGHLHKQMSGPSPLCETCDHDQHMPPGHKASCGTCHNP